VENRESVGALLHVVRDVARELGGGGVAADVALEADLERDLGLDSLARAALLDRLERRFGVRLPEDLLGSARTPADLLRALEQAGRPRPGPVSFSPEAARGKASPAGESARAWAALAGVPAGAATLPEALAWHATREPDRVHLRLWEPAGAAASHDSPADAAASHGSPADAAASHGIPADAAASHDSPADAAASHGSPADMTMRPGESATATVTYGKLAEAAGRVAAGLAQRGLAPGDRVALMLPTGVSYFETFLGVWLAGGVPVPLYPPARLARAAEHMRRQAGIIADAGAELLVVPSGMRLLAAALGGRGAKRVDVVGAGDLAAAPRRERDLSPRPEAVGLLQYTSGSTGSPKGVMLSHGQLLANIRAMGEALGIGPGDRFASWLPLYHDMGLIGAWLGSLYFGMPLLVMSPLAFLSRPVRWLQAISAHGATISAAPNFAYDLCAERIPDEDLAGLDLSRWRFALNGAEPVSAESLDSFCARFTRCGFRRAALMPVYGLAEAAVGLAFPPPGRGPLVDRIDRARLETAGRAEPAGPPTRRVLRVVSCGRALPGYEIRILAQDASPAAERQVGRIVFRGPSATAGYFRNPAETARITVDGWLDTGDLGYMAGGELYVTGRVKDVIIKAGRNLAPQDVEAAAGAVPGIRKGCVAAFGSRDPVTGAERLVVVAETRLAEHAARQAAMRRVASAVSEALGVSIDDIVLAPPHTVLKTSSGKIRRGATRDWYERGGAARPPLAAISLAVRDAAPRMAAVAYAAWAWTLFFALAIPVWLAMWVMPGPALRRRLAGAAMRSFFRLAGIPVAVRGREHLAARRPCIVVANHFSYLDGPLLAAFLDPEFDFVATRQLLAERFKRALLERLGVRFVDPRDPRAGIADLADLAAAARAGRSLAIFPEGHLSAEPGLRPFHLGAFRVAAQVGAEVVPVAIRGSRGVLAPYTWFPRRGALEIAVLPPLVRAGGDWAAAVDLRDRARGAIAGSCGEPAHSSGIRPDPQ